MAISFQSIGNLSASFQAASGLLTDAPCMVSANDTVSPAAKSGKFCGVVECIREGIASVILTGCVKLNYSGDTAPSVGYGILCADGDGGVCTAASGTSYLIVNVDTTEKTVEFFL